MKIIKKIIVVILVIYIIGSIMAIVNLNTVVADNQTIIKQNKEEMIKIEKENKELKEKINNIKKEAEDKIKKLKKEEVKKSESPANNSNYNSNTSATTPMPQMSTSEIDLLAKLVYHESNNQCMEGQQAVAEAALNRVKHPRFPNTLEGVLFQPGQFMSRAELLSVVPNDKNYEAVRRAMSSPVLPSTYVYFATTPCNGRNHIKIQDHYFGEV